MNGDKIMTKCAFLGLGVMGFHMAGHLVKTGHEVSVWNRTAQKAVDWAKQFKGQACGSVVEAVKDADFVIVCVGDDPDVYAVVREALPAMKAGAVLVDHTTASAECARTLYEESKAKSISFIDAPISGGESGAVNGQLSVMCGGDEAAYDKAVPIMDAYAKATTYLGPSGSGQLTKMCNQICIAGILQGLAEAVHFGKAAGLSISQVHKAIGKGAAQSWQMDNRIHTMDKGEYEFGFAVDWMRKDMRIALAEAERLGLDLKLTSEVYDYYADVQEMGGGRWDTSSLLARLENPKES